MTEIFRHYIKQLAQEQLAHMPAGTTRAQAEASIFQCEPVDGGGCCVYVCSACKTRCRYLPDLGRAKRGELVSRAGTLWQSI